MSRFRLQTFGGLALIDAEGREDRSLATRPRKLAVLAWLAMRPGRKASRDRIVGVFWAERDEDRARNSLSDALSHLRRVLGKDAIQTIGNDIALAGPELLDIDALELAAAAAGGDHEKVVGLYRGAFLDGFYIADAPELDDWRDRERARCAALFARSAANRSEMLAAASRWEECRALAERWLDAEPASTNAAMTLLRAIDAPGTRAAHAAAIQAYESIGRRLDQDLSIAPDRAVTAFARDIADTLSAQQDAAPVVVPPSIPSLVATSAEPKSPQARLTLSRRMRLTLAMTAGVATLGIALVALRRPAVLDHRRVVVLSFENRTGDTSLTAFGRDISDWLSRALTDTRALEVVDPIAPDAKAPHVDARIAGREARAGIVVTGAYSRQADSIVIDTRIIDATTGRELRAVPAVGAPASKPLDALANLRERVAGALAAEVDPMVAAIAREGSQPPTYEAYLAWVDGVDRFSHRDFVGSVAPLMRAAAADTNFISPRLWAGAALGNAGHYVRADSVFQSVAALRSTFAPLDRGLYDIWMANLRGDGPAEYSAAHEMLAAAPGSELAMFLAGLSAIKVNRPVEAMRVLRRIPIERSGASWNAYGTQLATALHFAGEYREELVEARRRSAAVPDWLPAISDEGRALAALGDLHALDSLVKRVTSLPQQKARTSESVMYTLAIELRAHDHPREAANVFRRTLEWLRTQPATEQQTAASRYLVARCLYETGDLAGADPMMRSLAGEHPEAAGYLAYVGTIAAARGDTAEAERVSRALEGLETPFVFGFPSLARARIAAILGRKAAATELVRRAIREGSEVRSLHQYTDLLRLRGYEPFDALMRPTG
jgi:DNA-binding SARP family transcriptional activator/TolB-like protein